MKPILFSYLLHLKIAARTPTRQIMKRFVNGTLCWQDVGTTLGQCAGRTVSHTGASTT